LLSICRYQLLPEASLAAEITARYAGVLSLVALRRRDLQGEMLALELRLIKWVGGVGIAATLAVGGMIWTATQVVLRALPHA
jgi:hypothetical protein